MDLISELKNELARLKEIKGEIAGFGLKELSQYVLRRKGEEGLKKIEEKIAEVGYSLNYDQINDISYYPLNYLGVFFVILKKILNWKENDFREMGKFAARTSIVSQDMMKFSFSKLIILKKIGEYWRKYYTVGELKIVSFNKKEKSIILELNFEESFPDHCRYLEGYFYQLSAFFVPEENLRVTETECFYKKGKKHVFRITW